MIFRKPFRDFGASAEFRLDLIDRIQIEFGFQYPDLSAAQHEFNIESFGKFPCLQKICERAIFFDSSIHEGVFFADQRRVLLCRFIAIVEDLFYNLNESVSS